MELILAVHYKTIIFVSETVNPIIPNLQTPNMVFQITVFIGGVAFVLLAFKSAGAASNLEQILKAAQNQLDKK